MKKRFLSLLLTILLLIPAGIAGPVRAQAAGAFPDIPDAATASAVETLRFMGVLGGFSDGTFRPNETLNRAQFCKMVVIAIGEENELLRYGSMTVFPDVKPSHWAAHYINLSARGLKIISGYSDGSFHPERPVTLGQACAILLRLLGWKDSDAGNVWPDGYLALAASVGLTDNVGGSGNAPLTRAQAARLFVNLLRSETSGGASFYTLSEETTLTSIDGGTGKLITTGKTYEMERKGETTTLVGSRGQVVLKDGKALTFLSVEADGSGTSSGSTGVVIVSASGSTAGLSALAGNTSFHIYKNGLSAAAKDLRAGDVAVYAPDTNAILVCDTRITAYYENCTPRPEAPTSIEILGTSFPVLPSASESLAQYRPGKVYTFLLAPDGQIAGAVDTSSGYRGNAVALIGSGVRLLCGAVEIPLHCAADNSVGTAARISSNESGEIAFTRLSSSASGALDVKARTVGNSALAENVRIFDGPDPIALTDLDRDQIPAAEISACRTNWAGKVDLIVINGAASTVLYGKAVVKTTTETTDEAVRDKNGVEPWEEDWIPTYVESRSSDTTVSIQCADRTVGPFATTIQADNGAFVEARLNRSGTGFSSIRTLKKLENVSEAAWVGKRAVTWGGETYSVAESVPCWNRDNGRWMTLDDAMSYASRYSLYVSGGAVRIVEVGSRL